MGSGEHYCLRWNNHQSNLLGVFSQLLEDGSLVDVTLACAEEGHSIRAHKVVLSACSSYFQTLFVAHPARHPIVILKDVCFRELRTLVEFMYKGEVNVEYCRLSALLKTAESLKVKGLAEMTHLGSEKDRDDRDRESSERDKDRDGDNDKGKERERKQEERSREQDRGSSSNRDRESRDRERDRDNQDRDQGDRDRDRDRERRRERGDREYEQDRDHREELRREEEMQRHRHQSPHQQPQQPQQLLQRHRQSHGSSSGHVSSPSPRSSSSANGLNLIVPDSPEHLALSHSHPHPLSLPLPPLGLAHPSPLPLHLPLPLTHHHSRLLNNSPDSPPLTQPPSRPPSHSRSLSPPGLSGSGPPSKRLATGRPRSRLERERDRERERERNRGRERDRERPGPGERSSERDSRIDSSPDNSCHDPGGPADHEGSPDEADMMANSPLSTCSAEPSDMTMATNLSNPSSSSNNNNNNNNGIPSALAGCSGCPPGVCGAASEVSSPLSLVQPPTCSSTASSRLASPLALAASPIPIPLPLPGPSGMPPVQQVPLSLKKEVDWDRDDKSASREGSSDYSRHPLDSESLYGGPCSSSSRLRISESQSSSRCSTPFQFPFPHFGPAVAAGYNPWAPIPGQVTGPPGPPGPGPGSGVDGGVPHPGSILSLLQHQTLLDDSMAMAGRCPAMPSAIGAPVPGSSAGSSSSSGSVGGSSSGTGAGTGSGRSRCLICLASFPTPWLLEQHMALQHAAYSSKYPSLAALSDSGSDPGGPGEEKPFRCEVCGQSYRYRSAYLKHREQNHRARLPADKLFTCEVCGMQFRYLKSFKKHRLNHALEKLRSRSPAECDTVSRPVSAGTPGPFNNGLPSMAAAADQTSTARSSAGTPSPFRPESSTDFSSRVLFVMSGGRMNGEFPLMSPGAGPGPGVSARSGRVTAPPTATLSPDADADQVSSSNETVGKSVERASSVPVSKAEHQNFYKFSLDDYYYLGSHSRGLVGEARSALGLGVSSATKSDTEQDDTIDSLAFALSMSANGGPDAFRNAPDNFYNLLRQREERRFACPFCGKCVRSKENLKLHVRKHTGERPFVCLFCGRAFGGKSDLTRHLRIHTGERPYHCEMCGKCFARADYLSKHLTTHIHHSQRGLHEAQARPMSRSDLD